MCMFDVICMLLMLQIKQFLFLIIGKTVKEFKAFIETDEDTQAKIKSLRTDVENFASTFPMPGFSEH